MGQPEQPWQPQQPVWAHQPGGVPPSPPTNGMAIGAFVASLLGLFCGLTFIVGVVLGHIARGQIRASGGRQGGDGLALAAIVIGWVGIGLMVLAVLFILAVVGVGMGTGPPPINGFGP